MLGAQVDALAGHGRGAVRRHSERGMRARLLYAGSERGMRARLLYAGSERGRAVRLDAGSERGTCARLDCACAGRPGEEEDLCVCPGKLFSRPPLPASTMHTLSFP